MWGKKKITHNEPINSEEYERISKRITLLVSDLDIVSNKLDLDISNLRKLKAELRRDLKTLEEEETEKSIKGDKLFI